jgi:predicted dehydrogenase
MRPTGRRAFLGAAGLGAVALSAGAGAARAAGRVVVGVIGPGGMGSHHVRHLAARKDVEIAYVCDPDSKRLV